MASPPWTEEQELFRQTVRRFAQEEIRQAAPDQLDAEVKATGVADGGLVRGP